VHFNLSIQRCNGLRWYIPLPANGIICRSICPTKTCGCKSAKALHPHRTAQSEIYHKFCLCVCGAFCPINRFCPNKKKINGFSQRFFLTDIDVSCTLCKRVWTENRAHTHYSVDEKWEREAERGRWSTNSFMDQHIRFD
jgi:hypothetical protein